MGHTEEVSAASARRRHQLAGYYRLARRRPVPRSLDPRELERLFDEPVPRKGEAAPRPCSRSTRAHPVCNAHGQRAISPDHGSPLPIGSSVTSLRSALNQNSACTRSNRAAVALERPRTERWPVRPSRVRHRRGRQRPHERGMGANAIGLKLALRFSLARPRAGRLHGERWPCSELARHRVAIDKAVTSGVRPRVGACASYLRALPGAHRPLEKRFAQPTGRAGIRLRCIVALAGTTNTGSVVRHSPRCAQSARPRKGWLHATRPTGEREAALEALPRRARRGSSAPTRITIDPHNVLRAGDAGAVAGRDSAPDAPRAARSPAYLRTGSNGPEER
jgi:hypothetical protein